MIIGNGRVFYCLSKKEEQRNQSKNEDEQERLQRENKQRIKDVN